MSHKISMEEARMLHARSMELQQMQKEGKKLPKSRRRNRAVVAKKKQATFIQRIKDRIITAHGKMPEELKEEDGI